MRERLAQQALTVPAQYADNDVRRERIKFIRKYCGRTQREFAAMMGLNLIVYTNVEYGRTKCQMVYLRLAETLMQAHRQKQNRLRVKADKAIAAAQNVLAGLPEPEL